MSAVLESILDKILLIIFYIALVVLIVKGSPDHDTQMWLKEGAALILGSLLTLINTGSTHVTQQNDISNSTVNQPTTEKLVNRPVNQASGKTSPSESA